MVGYQVFTFKILVNWSFEITRDIFDNQ